MGESRRKEKQLYKKMAWARIYGESKNKYNEGALEVKSRTLSEQENYFTPWLKLTVLCKQMLRNPCLVKPDKELQPG